MWTLSFRNDDLEEQEDRRPQHVLLARAPASRPETPDAYLLSSSWGWSMSNLAAMIRLNLFTYRDLHKGLNEPFTPPDVGLTDLQLMLAV
jgi:hypothetical protein